MILIDKLCYQSRLRHANPYIKFLFAMTSLCFCIGNRSVIMAVILLFVMGSMTVLKGGLSPFLYLRLLSLPLVFLLTGVLAVLLDLSSVPSGRFSIPLGSIYLVIRDSQIQMALRLFFTALSCTSCLYFLSLTTPIPDLLHVLRTFHIPSFLLDLMFLTYRYVFILLSLASTISIAQQSRLGNRTLRLSRNSFVKLLGSLFVLSIRKSSGNFDAMESRGYSGSLTLLPPLIHHRKKDWILLGIFEIILLIWTVLIRSGRLS